MSAATAAPVSPSQFTAPSYRPAPSAAPTAIVIPPGQSSNAPSGSENLALRIGRVEIVGGFDELAQAGERTARTLEGRRVSVARIFAAANALEQAYAAAGYLLARVAVPPQRLVDGGPLKLAVIDGVFESVDLTGVPERAREAVRRRTSWLIGVKRLKLKTVERALLIAGETPGLTLQSAIARGDNPGGAKLVLQGVQNWTTGATTFDNRLPAALGSFESISTLSLDNPLGIGESFYLSAGLGAPFDLSRLSDSHFALASLGASFPIGGDGFTMSPEYTHSLTRPIPAPGVPPSAGDFDRFALRGSYDLDRTRLDALKLEGEFGFVSQRNLAEGFAAPLDQDAYAYSRAGLDYSGPGFGAAAIEARLEASKGLGGRGSEQAASSGVPLSRLGASPYFRKADIEIKYSQPLPLGARLDLVGRGQWSFAAPLFVSEQFALDATNGVSAFPSGAFSVDSGATMRTELTRPFVGMAGGVASMWSPYLFAAAGAGSLARPTAVETGDQRAGALGLGLRLQCGLGGADAITGGAEIARQYTNIPTRGEGYRMSVNMGAQF